MDKLEILSVKQNGMDFSGEEVPSGPEILGSNRKQAASISSPDLNNIENIIKAIYKLGEDNSKLKKGLESAQKIIAEQNRKLLVSSRKNMEAAEKLLQMKDAFKGFLKSEYLDALESISKALIEEHNHESFSVQTAKKLELEIDEPVRKYADENTHNKQNSTPPLAHPIPKHLFMENLGLKAALAASPEVPNEKDANNENTVKPFVVEHKQYSKQASSSKYECSACNKHYTYLSCLRKHIQWRHKSEPISQQATGPRRYNKIKSFTTSPKAIANIGCQSCRAKFKTFAELRQHQKSKHKPKTQPLGSNFLKQKDTSRTMSAIEASRSAPTQNEGNTTQTKTLEMKEIKSETLIDVHREIIPTRGKFYRCTCGSKFSSNENLQLHFKRKNQKWDFYCEICDKPFYRKGPLNNHMRVKHKI